jgi:methylphosphotriester-DNA--protein-cysteine methyltransferase
VYVALTTSIYCRPSCPARLPQRCNVLLIPTADEAERRGYTACRRCHPATGALAPGEKAVKAALEYIETHLDHAMTLRTLSQVAGLSPNHLQRIFTRIVGLSPKTFRDYRRLARLKEYLRRGESVGSASYAAGYGSIRSLYEKAYKALGMTPATYRNGGHREHIRYATSSVTFGRLLVAGTERGVCGVLLGDMTGGVMALVGAKLLGPRVGKYPKDGKVNPIPAHNVPMVVTGTLILAFGWFGFNPGSTLASSDVRISVIATNTMLASASGALAACVFVWLRFGKPDVTMICNGLLAGLVAITAPCAFVSAGMAVLVGAVAGVLVVAAALFIERKLKVDDPVGAVAVHGCCGAWGILSVGLFSNGTYGEGLNGVDGPVKGLLYGDSGQLVASCIGILVNVVWVGVVSIVTLLVIDKLVGNRVSEQSEIEGLDHGEMGMPGYATEPGRASPPEMGQPPEGASLTRAPA